MSGLLESLERWIATHTRLFAALPPVTVPSAAISDEETEHWGDLRYMEELVDDFFWTARATAANIVGPLIETALTQPMIGDDYKAAS